jgi:hypothetical protein
VSEVCGTLHWAASHGEPARQLVHVIGGQIEVPSGVRALTMHSSGRGNRGGSWWSAPGAAPGWYRPRRLVRALDGSSKPR